MRIDCAGGLRGLWAADVVVAMGLVLLLPVVGVARGDDAGNQIEFWYGPVQEFGHVGGHPQQQINILGHVALDAKIAKLEFSIDGGDPKKLSFKEDKKRIAKDGDFNIEIDRGELLKGRSTVTVIATSKGGGKVRKSVTVIHHEIRPGKRWPLPYKVDWSEVEHIQDVVQVVDGKWELTKDGVRSVERYYDRCFAFGDASWQDYEVTTSVIVHKLTGPREGPNSTGVTHAAIALRWPGHDYDGKQPTVKWHPLGATAEFRLGKVLKQCRWRVFDGQRQYYKESPRRRVLQFETPYSMKHQVITAPSGESIYRTRLWKTGEREPEAWDLERVEPKDDVPRGSALLLAHHSDVTFGDIEVVDLQKLEPESPKTSEAP